MKVHDIYVPHARKEYELANELLQRALVCNDRLARQPFPRPCVLHRLHYAARAFPKVLDERWHAIGPGAVIAATIPL